MRLVLAESLEDFLLPGLGVSGSIVGGIMYTVAHLPFRLDHTRRSTSGGVAPYQLGEMEDLGYSPSTRMPEKRAARIIKRLQLLETTRSEIDDCAMAGTLDQRRGRLASMRQHLERNYEAACARTTELSLTDGECRHDLKALASARQNLLHAILEAELAAEMSP